MKQEHFNGKTIDLADGLDALMPSTHPHVGKFRRTTIHINFDRSVDQSPAGAVSRCKMHMGPEAEYLLKGRYRIIKSYPI
jgi:hypothetical protein